MNQVSEVAIHALRRKQNKIKSTIYVLFHPADRKELERAIASELNYTRCF